MEFEWDAAKSETTFHQRGFDFAFAAGIFGGPTVEAIDTRHDYGEIRVRAIGQSAGVTMVVIYTQRAHVRRIISARLANRRECATWLTQCG